MLLAMMLSIVAAGTAAAANLPPNITQQPTNTAGLLGGEVLFFVTAEGSTPLNYQWLFGNGGSTNVPVGTNGPVLRLVNLQLAQAGNYRVVITNQYGSMTSSNARLAVWIPPVLNQGPSNATVVAGTEFHFNAQASGLPAPSFQWRLNGADITGATDPVLTISQVAASHAGEYSVVAFNNAGSVTSAPAILSVVVPPSIQQHPVSQAVGLGQAVTFTVVASGIPAVTYQWRFNGTDIAGATGPSHTISSVGLSSLGLYSVVVANPGGVIESARAQLTLSVAPVITRQPSNQTWPAGAQATFWVEASGSSPLRYQWQFNGVDIPGATSSRLLVSLVNSNRAGSYRVLVSNPFGSVPSQDAMLTVFSSELPFTDNFEDQTALGAPDFQGHGVNFMASRQPYEPLHAGRPGSNSMWISWIAPEDGLLKLDTAGSDFDTLLAVYRETPAPPTNSVFDKLQLVAANDDADDALSAWVQCNVVAGEIYRIAVDGFRNQQGNIVLRGHFTPSQYQLPVFLQQPQGRILPAGSTVVFNAQFDGSAPMLFQWQRNGVNLTGANSPTLTLSNLVAEQAGNYTLWISNAAGVVQSEPATLLITLPDSILANHLSDRFAGRIALQSPYFRITGHNFDAQRQLTEPRHAGKPGRHSVWVSWIAPANGVVILNTTNSTFDTLLGVYTNNVLKMLAEVESDDDSGWNGRSLLQFNAIAGVVYHIAVDGYGDSAGNIELEGWLQTAASVLPQFLLHPQDRTALYGQAVNLDFLSDAGANSIVQWWFNGSPVSAGTGGSNYIPSMTDNYVGLYRVQLRIGTAMNYSHYAELQINSLGLSNVMARDKMIEALSFGQVDRSTTTDLSDYGYLTPPGLNADGKGDEVGVRTKAHAKASGTDPSGFTTTQIFSTFGSSSETGEPAHCGLGPWHSKWYTYQVPTNAPANSVMKVSTEGSSFSNVLAAYVGPGTDYSTLTNVGCGITNSGTTAARWSETLFPVTNGTVHFLAVDGVNSNLTGTVRLTILVGQPPQITTAPLSRIVLPGSNVLFSVTAGGMTNLTYQWRFNGTNITWATNTSMTVTNAQGTNAGSYTVVVQNPISSVTSSVATLTVIQAPVVAQQPVSMAIVSGSNATVSALVSGFPTPRNQWFSNSVAMGTHTNLSFTITNFQLPHQGRYYLRSTNALGSATTDEIELWLVNTQSIMVRFGATNGAFLMRVASPSSNNHILEASTNLTSWVPIATNPAPYGIVDFLDAAATNFPHRFYRARPQ